METRKLFYEDCHLREFSARVLRCAQTDKGWAVVLDATAFYPEGGGQACDLGTLGGAAVLDVREQGAELIHLCDGPLEPGTEVTGKLDWDRRFDQMQQHTGEHIYSGLVHEKFGYHNSGFHVGAGWMEVDFDGPMTLEEALELERRANEAIWKNLPIRCWYPSPAELPTVGYRTKRALPWPVRVVEIPGYDKCACCGVHVGSTGEVGILKILSAISFRGGTRLQMVCGRRAYDYLGEIWNQNRLVSQAFSAKMQDTGAAALRMNETLAGEKLRANSLEKRIFRQIAQSYANCGGVVHFEPDLTSGGVRELADAIGAVCGGVAAVLSGEEGNYQLCLIGPAGPVKETGTALVKALNGRGGGKPGSFQGMVRATRREIEAFFREVLSF